MANDSAIRRQEQLARRQSQALGRLARSEPVAPPFGHHSSFERVSIRSSALSGAAVDAEGPRLKHSSAEQTTCHPWPMAGRTIARISSRIRFVLQPRDEMNGTQENLSGRNQMREEFVGSHLAQPQATLSIRASGCPVLPISFILVLPRKLAVLRHLPTRLRWQSEIPATWHSHCTLEKRRPSPLRSSPWRYALNWLVREQTHKIAETPWATQDAGINSRGAVFSMGTSAVLGTWPGQPSSWAQVSRRSVRHSSPVGALDRDPVPITRPARSDGLGRLSRDERWAWEVSTSRTLSWLICWLGSSGRTRVRTSSSTRCWPPS